MKNPNRGESVEVLQRRKEASYERMRVELYNSVVLLLADFELSWDDLGKLLGEEESTPGNGPSVADRAKWKILKGQITLIELNTLTHIFSCEPYLIFRPRLPWTKS